MERGQDVLVIVKSYENAHKLPKPSYYDETPTASFSLRYRKYILTMFLNDRQ